MNTDIRISTTIFTNIKIKRLIRRKGSDGLSSLLSLWIFTATHRPNGVLTDMDDDDLMDAANTNDELFVKLLVDLKLLDWDGNNYKIHDWDEHNHWCFGAQKRSESARKAINSRWDKIRNSKEKK